MRLHLPRPWATPTITTSSDTGDHVESLADLAYNEITAESRREEAERAWRNAWWELTLCLGDLAQTQVGPAYDELADLLGQRRDYLSLRRRVGQAVQVDLIGINTN